MSQIIFYCSSCGMKLSAELDEVNCEFECPHCKKIQIVPNSRSQGPGGPTTVPSSTTAYSSAVILSGMSGTVSPKRKIVVSNQSMEHEDDEDEPEVEGTGLTLFAVAIGTSSLLLCGFSIIWMFVSKWWEHLEQWPIILMVFLASFLMGLMGLVIAHLSRLVVKLAYRLSRMDTD